MTTPTMPREFEFERVFNFRDLGGYAVADGRRVRWRRLFRSGALHRMSEDEAARTAADLGIGTVIDLRSDAEVDHAGLGPFVAGTVRHHVPFGVDPSLLRGDGGGGGDGGDDADGGDDGDNGRWEFGEHFYVDQLDRWSGGIGEALHLLADEDHHPALFHCSAGKDRTGVLSALLLDTLGVDEATIVDDYAISERHMARLAQQMRDDGRIKDGQQPHPGLGVWPEAIRRLFEAVREQHGSVAGYLETLGVSERTRRRLVELLVE